MQRRQFLLATLAVCGACKPQPPPPPQTTTPATVLSSPASDPVEAPAEVALLTSPPRVILLARSGGPFGGLQQWQLFLDDRRVISIVEPLGSYWRHRPGKAWSEGIRYSVERLHPDSWKQLTDRLALADASETQEHYSQKHIRDGGYTELAIQQGERYITIVNRPADLPAPLADLLSFVRQLEPTGDAFNDPGADRLLIAHHRSIPGDPRLDDVLLAFADGLTVYGLDSWHLPEQPPQRALQVRVLSEEERADLRAAIAANNLKTHQGEPPEDDRLEHHVVLRGIRRRFWAPPSAAEARLLDVTNELRLPFPAAVALRH